MSMRNLPVPFSHRHGVRLRPGIEIKVHFFAEMIAVRVDRACRDDLQNLSSIFVTQST
jgi:hypothetical protein